MSLVFDLRDNCRLELPQCSLYLRLNYRGKLSVCVLVCFSVCVCGGDGGFLLNETADGATASQTEPEVVYALLLNHTEVPVVSV